MTPTAQSIEMQGIGLSIQTWIRVSKSWPRLKGPCCSTKTEIKTRQTMDGTVDIVEHLRKQACIDLYVILNLPI